MPFLSTLGIIGFYNEVLNSILTDLLCMFGSMDSLLGKESCVHAIFQLNRETAI